MIAGIDPDYVDVAERIREFYAKYPTGSLQALCDGVPMEVGGHWYVKYVAAAYRTPDDPCPGVGAAWEPVPGPTPFTKNSELQNAETSAWGRAIVAVGIPSKKIATAQDVQNRQAEPLMDGQLDAPDEPRTDAQAAAIENLQGRLYRGLGETEGKKVFARLRAKLGAPKNRSLTSSEADIFIASLLQAALDAEAVPA